MNKDKLRHMINVKSNGDNNLSAQLYQMFFFERILERISKSKYRDNIILKGRFATFINYWRRYQNHKRYGCNVEKYSS